ncbi:MAG: 3D-(3,5/4)-trihydroxycyclohexane-1,2-dione acylhydrolase (decyclizing) [Candidatus Latescibacteria bacterium]|nr:3D-(3,5/4)-trihydroxycyclohexane-1,2-dione acylhydrolase (decyclizing) [Candidatus Latescibacterota bacterium]
MPEVPGNDTIRLTMAQALVKYLQVQYSERDGQQRRLIPGIFGIFGHGNVAGLGQALQEYGRDLPYYQPCNEQGQVHVASGFARANRRLATLACTSSIGPGATNMVTGAATATVNRLPVLLLPSDYYATRYQGTVLQQLEHPVSADISVNDCLRPVSRFFDRIMRPEQLLTALPEAMRVLLDPADTGAVTVSLPQDVQAQAYDYPAHFFEPRVWRVERRPPEPEIIAQALALLKAAQRPLIIAGGGVHYSAAGEQLRAFAEECGIPVSETFAGKGAVSKALPMLLGGQGTNGTPVAAQMAAQADVVLCVGTRLSDFITGAQSIFQNPGVRFISVNVCGRDANKMGALPIVADARRALEALRKGAQEVGLASAAAYQQEVVKINGEWRKRVEEEVYGGDSTPMPQAQLVGVLNEEAQEGDTIIAAAGGPPGDLHKLWDATQGRHCHVEFGFSCMGYEIPAGIGVRMQQKEGEVIVFIGDGTYLMNPTELVTAIQEGLKLTVVLSENHGFQCIRGLQLARAGISFGNEFRRRDPATGELTGKFLPIDFAANGESFGAKVWRAQTVAEVRTALQQARQESDTCLIVVETDRDQVPPESGAWIDFAVAQVSGDSLTQDLRREYEEAQRRQRLHY